MPAPQPANTPYITCSGCHHTWTAGGAAHCAAPGCHRLFSTARLFDLHRTTKGGDHGSCINPERIVSPSGEPLMVLRAGVWRGPEMTEEQKLARFGDKGAA